MIRNYCMHCGLMDNGIFIDTKKPIKETDIEIYLEKEYDKITRNQNWFIAGLLGPVYILCRGNFIIGTILTIIDMLILTFILCINHWPLFLYIVASINATTLIISRVIWATINNIIYLKLIKRKINKAKEKYKDKYQEKLPKLHEIDLFILPFKYVVFFLIALIIFASIVSYVYSMLNFIGLFGIL